LEPSRESLEMMQEVPIDVTAGWAASPVDTRPPGPYLTAG